jgi:hydroxyacylglutathione hydrolase
MIIHTIPSGPFDTNAYIVACPDTGIGAVIDPAVDGFEAIEAKAGGITIDKILITHSHWDHIGAAAKLKQMFHCPVYIHPLDGKNLESPGSDRLPCWVPIEGVKPDIFMADGEVIPVGKLLFKVIHTPGHSPGGVSFYCEKENVLFSGDTLFKGSIGNLSFPTSEPEKMWASLDKLASLPGNTVVYPGHGPKTTIAEESWLPRAREMFS